MPEEYQTLRKMREDSPERIGGYHYRLMQKWLWLLWRNMHGALFFPCSALQWPVLIAILYQPFASLRFQEVIE